MFITTTNAPSCDTYTKPARAEVFENEGDKWPIAVVVLANGTEEEAAICAEALAHDVKWEAWPVHYSQLGHWVGGPATPTGY